ncbi:unnamed protein product [Urochloa decumbens]|uniref:F-box domain-containing protein n=1 Tax=Urochloa decumbens TaxID=240449 RepID=A0ABC9G8W7_9POAL
MGRRRGSKRRTAAGGGGGDRLTALPLELRAQIASCLPFKQAVQLSALSRPWRRIHHHTPVVRISLRELVSVVDAGDGRHSLLVLDVDSAVATHAVLARRLRDVSASRVEALALACYADNARTRYHADRIIAAADARDIRIDAPSLYPLDQEHEEPWTLDLPAGARSLEVDLYRGLAPAIADSAPGAAALRSLSLDNVELRGWPPLLPSLRSLSLRCAAVRVKAPFAPAAWCPALEDLDISSSTIEHGRVDIRLPRLRYLDMDDVDVVGPPGVVAVDAPEMVELDVYCSAGCTADLRSFSLRAPRLRVLRWENQYAERVHMDAAAVEVGVIRFTERVDVDAGRPARVVSTYTRQMKCYREQMTRMLQGLLPNLPPERIADVSKPCMELEVHLHHEVDEYTGEMTKEEKLTCDLKALKALL